MSYEFIPYETRFRDQVVDLQRHLWSTDAPANSAYFAWKYERNPFLATPLLYLALHHGRVVGVRGIFGAKWRISQSATEMAVPLNADSFLLPAHRKAGVYHKLTALLIEDLSARGFPYVLNLSASRRTLLNALMLGWRKMGSFEPLVLRSTRAKKRVRRRQQLEAFLQPQRRRIANWALSKPMLSNAAQRGKELHKQRFTLPTAKRMQLSDETFRQLDAQDFSTLAAGRGRVTVEKATRPAAMARLADRCDADSRVAHVSDERYFAWRFQNPFAQYRFLYCGEEDLQGYLVVCHSAIYRSGEVTIVDWRGESEETMACLLGALIEAGEFESLVIWTSSLGAGAKALLRAKGFEPLRIGGEANMLAQVPVIRSLQDGNGPSEWQIDNLDLLDIANWNLRALDSDAH